MDRAKNYDELKKKILKELRNSKPKTYSNKVYHAPKSIYSNEKI